MLVTTMATKCCTFCPPMSLWDLNQWEKTWHVYLPSTAQLTHWCLTKWPPFCIRHFQSMFLKEIIRILLPNSFKVVPNKLFWMRFRSQWPHTERYCGTSVLIIINHNNIIRYVWLMFLQALCCLYCLNKFTNHTHTSIYMQVHNYQSMVCENMPQQNN